MTFLLVWRMYRRVRMAESTQSFDQGRRMKGDTIAEWQALLDRRDQDFDDLKKEFRTEVRAARTREDECKDRLALVDVRAGRLESHVAYIEHELKRNDIDYVPWANGTGDHPPAGDHP